MTRRVGPRKKRYGKKNVIGTFFHNTMVDVAREQRAKSESRARAAAKADRDRAASARQAHRRKEGGVSSTAKQRAEAKRAEKYLGWSKLLCLKHDLPAECAEFIARQAMDMHASKRDIETVIIAKRDWRAFDWKAAKRKEEFVKNAAAAMSKQFRTELMRAHQHVPAETPAMATRAIRFVLRWLGYLAAWTLALVGVVVMAESEHAWYWYTPLLLPALYLVARSANKEEEKAEAKQQQKTLIKAEPVANNEPSLVWKLFKWAFWLGLGWLVLYIGSYYLLAAIMFL